MLVSALSYKAFLYNECRLLAAQGAESIKRTFTPSLLRFRECHGRNYRMSERSGDLKEGLQNAIWIRHRPCNPGLNIRGYLYRVFTRLNLSIAMH